jgi:hypothetical protein
VADDPNKQLLQRGGAGGYDIWVDPDALRSVARQFVTIITEFDKKVQDFTRKGKLHDRAFGSLPQAQDTIHHYHTAYGDAQTGLKGLELYVTEIAQGLIESADSYDGADAGSTVR